MKDTVILVTGAVGFIGSSLVIDLSKDQHVIGLDKRKPSEALIKATPNVTWMELDIADVSNVNLIFQQVILLLKSFLMI